MNKKGVGFRIFLTVWIVIGLLAQMFFQMNYWLFILLFLAPAAIYVVMQGKKPW